MTQDTLPVALGIIQNGSGELLLVHREKGDFPGLWGFPGGKIERNEFVAGAIEREVEEETGVSARFQRHLGIVSEHVMKEGELVKHVPLHICFLDAESGEDGDNADWKSMEEIRNMEDETIPSLLPIVEDFLPEPEKRYYESVIEKKDGEVEHRRFE